MPRLRNALTVAAAGLALAFVGAGTAAATPGGDCPPPTCSDSSEDGCSGGGHGGHGGHGGMGVGLDLGGLLDGLFGGFLGGGGGACCHDD